MSRPARVLVACVLVLLGVTAALFFVGKVGACLGPLGVTAVQCAKSTGVVPDVGIGLPILALTIAAATFIIAPVSASQRSSVLVAMIVGGAIGAAAFLALRPRTMEGLDSSGSWISILRPIDPYAMATAIVAGTLLGVVVVRLLPWLQRLRLARS